MNKIYQVINHITQEIEPACQSSALATNYAWWMLEALTQKNKAHLITQSEITLTKKQQALLDFWIDQHVNHHKPLAYLLGSVPFSSLTILVEPPILIPRPETEQWCLELIETLSEFADHTLTILDLCTGSGCIALALAQAFPHFTVWGIDKSVQAIALAKKNASYNAIHNAHFLVSDLFEELTNKTFDLIIANPPYIAFSELPELDVSVTKWEDKDALFANDNGLSVIKKIITKAPDYLNKQSVLVEKKIPQVWIEIGYKQKNLVVEFMKTAQYSDIQVFKDLSQKERVVAGSVSDVATAPDK